MRKIIQFIKKYRIELIIFVAAFLFSTWLMFSTFSYQNGNMLIASKAWSDFASHIPLIRSFSFGDNFPPQYPLFSGPPVKYHFLFYALTGLFEKFGLRIDYAFNILSVLGFSFLILMIYVLAKKIFKSKTVGLLSIMFFLFNGSLSFVNFFSKYPLSQNTLTQVILNRQFPSFGPYDQSIVSAFWNLNIYTNQRHLALSYGLSLILVFFLLKPFFENKKPNIKINIFLGIVLGLSFFLNIAVFLMTAFIFGMLLILVNKNRLNIFVSIAVGGLIALPQYFFMQSASSASSTSLYPGYLINNNLTIPNFINYWFQNLGLHLILIPLGFLIAPKNAKKIFVAFFSLFIVGNLFKFSPEVAANHKFFNYFMIIGIMFSAYVLYYVWNNKKIFRPLVPILFFLLIFSGIIDFFPIFNDTKIALADYPKNKDISWIMQNTKPNSVFLNTNYLYDNASLAGRKIFLGWPYFSWSQGYDTLKRDNLRKSLLNTNDLNFFCKNVKENNISYAEITSTENLIINNNFFENNFILAYKNLYTNTLIYNLKSGCK